jgi:prepilin-type N-terminal cleavage/methylation domain-containing protein
MLPAIHATSTGSRQRGFTLVELLVSMSITTVIMGATMTAMQHAINATDAALLLTSMNNGLRTSMDLMVRDLLQVGQGLPSGHVVMVPAGPAALVIRMPGPPGTNFLLTSSTGGVCPALNNCTEISAVMPGPGLGPVIAGVATDMITTLQVDSAFDQVRLTAFAADGASIGVDPAVNITDLGPDDIHPGDLIVLMKGSLSALMQVSRVVGQDVFFDAADSMNLNQQAGGLDGTARDLRSSIPVDVAPAPPAPCGGPAPQPSCTTFVPTLASRVRMLSYYIDNVTDPLRPRLVRRMNNGHATIFDNTLGTAVAFDVENLQISYDLADGVSNPANVKMVTADLDGTGLGRCVPNPCSRNNIRKVNIVMAGRSKIAAKGTRQFLRNRLQTQVSLRSLAFVDRYR